MVIAKQQMVKNTKFSTTTSSAEALKNNESNLTRIQLVLTNNSNSVITIAKGSVPVVSGEGIILPPNAIYYESSDAGMECWQGAIQVIGDVAGVLAIVEAYENRGVNQF